MKEAGIPSLAVLLAVASPAEASCGYGTWLHPRVEEGTVEVNTFGYTGPTGPANWVALDPTANALCSSGTNQSPVDMVADTLPIIPAAQISLSLADMPSGTEFENLGTTVEVVAAEEGATSGSTMTFGGVNYALQQFHFHLPSEHLDAGRSMAMEMHMVWEGEAGEVAVLGVFIDIDDGTAGEQPVAPVTPNTTETATVSSRASSKNKRRQLARQESQERRRKLPGVDGSFFHISAPDTAATVASTLLETVLGSVQDISEPGAVTTTQPLIMAELASVLNSGSFQTYEGSLTTPPCSEGVRWLVSDQKLSIQAATFVKARSVIGFNSRFPQNTLGQENVLSLAAKS